VLPLATTLAIAQWFTWVALPREPIVVLILLLIGSAPTMRVIVPLMACSSVLMMERRSCDAFTVAGLISLEWQLERHVSTA